MSKNNTSNAELAPPILNTFVAPGLTEPFSLGSGKPLILQTNIALEIDPAKYATIIIKTVKTMVFKLVSLLILGYYRACFFNALLQVILQASKASSVV